jgi:hypothetical protein
MNWPIGKLCRLVEAESACGYNVISDDGKVLAVIPYGDLTRPPSFFDDPITRALKWQREHLAKLDAAMGRSESAVPVDVITENALSAIAFAKAHDWTLDNQDSP